MPNQTTNTPAGGVKVEQSRTMGQRFRAALNVFFGPDYPQNISAPDGTPPRQFDYPTGYNLNIQPHNLEPVSYHQMRNLADSFDLVRLCIETRKDQLAKMQWQFTVKRNANEKNGEYKARAGSDDRIAQLTDFFASPDKEHTWAEWARMLLEEMLVIDAAAIVPTTDANGTLWTKGKKLYGLDVIDGATIARKIDTQGRTPAEPAVAYQQIIKGLPAVDFMRSQLLFKPRNLRTHKFFGYSPVEQIIMTINIGLRRQIHLLNYYTEGNVPEAIAQTPASWGADQIKEFQDWFDASLSGNLAQRRKITFIPEAGEFQFTRAPELKDPLDEWLARIVCYGFSLSPQPFITAMNRATAETSVEQAAAEGLSPIMLWFEDAVNTLVLRYFGWNDIEFSFVAAKDENPVEQAEIIDKYLRNGSMTIDQAADTLGFEPLPNGTGARNMIYTAMGAVPVDKVIENADNPPEPPPVQQVGPDGKPVAPPVEDDGGKKPVLPKDKKPKKTAKRDYAGYEANKRPSL